MKAILLKEYEIPYDLRIEEVAKPFRKQNEVSVRVHSAFITDCDWGLVRASIWERLLLK